MADRPSNTGREDTVALPLPPKRPAQGTSNGDGSSSSSGSSGSNGRVLPPMPPGQSTGDSTSNGSTTPPPAPPAATPPARSRGAAKKAAKQPAKPKPATPPAQARKSSSARPAPAKGAQARPAATPPPAAAPTAPPATQPSAAPTTAAPVAQPSPATQSRIAQSPAARTTETARPAAAPPPVVAPAAKVKPVKEPKQPRPTRADKKAERTVAGPRPGRRARLRLTRIDPWSVMKTSFLLSIALGIVIVVSVLMVWTVLSAANVWDSINQTVQDVVGGQDATTFDIEDYLGTRRVVGFTMIVAAVDVVLVTAICTLGAFLYNMSASLLGGIEVTLAEDN